jgi:hypothetical protein
MMCLTKLILPYEDKQEFGHLLLLVRQNHQLLVL